MMTLVKSVEVLGKWLLKHIGSIRGWPPLCHVEGAVWNGVSLPKLPLPSFTHAPISSEFLFGISNKRLYLPVAVGSAAWCEGLRAPVESGHPAGTVSFCSVPVLVARLFSLVGKRQQAFALIRQNRSRLGPKPVRKGTQRILKGPRREFVQVKIPVTDPSQPSLWNGGMQGKPRKG